MDTRPIIFLDSGLGSLPYGRFFHSQNKAEKLICLGDWVNYPYGQKSKDALISIIDSLTDRVFPLFKPKIFALACNSASVTALEFLRKKYPDTPIVGTVPAIKPAVTASKTRRVGVLGTVMTIEDPLIRKLAARYGPDCEILGKVATDLIEFAQRRYGAADHAERLHAVIPYVEAFRSSGADAIVLGCTHFLLLREEFLEAAGSDIVIYDSVEGVSNRVESILDKDGLRSGTEGSEAPRFVVTGEDALEPYWENLSSQFGFTLERIT